MSYGTPTLTSGNFARQSVYEWLDVPAHTLGTRGIMQDGRAFYYAANRGAAIDAGALLAGAVVSGDFQECATNTAQVGDTTVNVTPAGSTTYSVNELEGGFLSIDAATAGNEGRQYRIVSNPATTAATAFDLVVEPIREEDFVAGTTATVAPNLWSSITTSPTSVAAICGAAVMDIPAGTTDAQFGWVQTWGQATVRNVTAGDIVGHQLIQNAASAGAVIGMVDASSGDVTQTVAANRVETTAGASYYPVMLKIAP